MGFFRFRRTVKIVPGVRLNLSGSGASVYSARGGFTSQLARTARGPQSVCPDQVFRGRHINLTVAAPHPLIVRCATLAILTPMKNRLARMETLRLLTARQSNNWWPIPQSM